MILESWYGKPVAAVCVLAGLLALGAVALSQAEFGPRESPGRAAFAVTLRHDGVDAEDMERSITEPLEDGLSSVPGRGELRSTTERGKSRVVVYLEDPSVPFEEAYAAVRDASERVYAALPDSVQRPEIASTSEGGRPAWIAAVKPGTSGDDVLEETVEKRMKASFAKIPGSGDVECSGTGAEEIRVLVEPARAAAFGVDLQRLGAFIAGGDAALPVGGLREGQYRLPVEFAGRLPDPEDCGALLVPTDGGLVPVSAFARVERGRGNPDSISRVDGVPSPVIAVMPGGRANLVALSEAVARERAAWEGKGYGFSVIADVGAELAASFRGILSATFQGMAFVAVCMPFLAGGARVALAAVLSVPVTAFAAAFLLAALRVPFDDSVLSGLAAGLGASVDAVVVALERIGLAKGDRDAAARMKALLPSLIGGAATMIVVLVPLSSGAFGSGSLAATSLAVGAVAVSALACAVFVAPLVAMAGPRIPGRGARLPPGAAAARAKKTRSLVPRTGLVPSTGPVPRTGTGPRFRGAKRALTRLLARAIVGSARKPLIPLALCAACAIAAVVVGAMSPLDYESAGDEGSVAVHVECERGASIESVDARLASYAERLESVRGVRMVQTSAKPGAGDAEIAFDPKLASRADIAAAARRLGASVPDAFVYLPGGGDPRERSYELSVSGDDDATVKAIASEVASRLSESPLVSDVVLNFKEGPDALVYEPDPFKLSAAAAADSLRRFAYGPVVHKSLSGGDEIDVRIMAAGARDADEAFLSALPVPLRGGKTAPAAAVGNFSRERETARIYRKDRRRTAFLTMRTREPDVGKARAAGEAALRATPMPPGYGWEFDREAIRLEADSRKAVAAFALAVALVYAILAALSESFGSPLLALLVLPPAMLPALAALAAGSGALRVSGIGSLVLLAGIAVNSSIIVVDEARARGLGRGGSGSFSMFGAIRSRAGALAATTLTAVAGALPLVLAPGSGASFLRSVAAATALGTVGAYVGAVTVLPAAIAAFPRLLRKHEPRTGRVAVRVPTEKNPPDTRAIPDSAVVHRTKTSRRSLP